MRRDRTRRVVHNSPYEFKQNVVSTRCFYARTRLAERNSAATCTRPLKSCFIALVDVAARLLHSRHDSSRVALRLNRAIRINELRYCAIIYHRERETQRSSQSMGFIFIFQGAFFDSGDWLPRTPVQCNWCRCPHRSPGRSAAAAHSEY